jgi:hypothetical protein
MKFCVTLRMPIKLGFRQAAQTNAGLGRVRTLLSPKKTHLSPTRLNPNGFGLVTGSLLGVRRALGALIPRGLMAE